MCDVSAPHAGGMPVPEEPPRAFVDTNIWISAFINPSGPPAAVLDAFIAGKFVPVVSRALIDQIHEVASRPHIRRRISDDDLATLLVLLLDRAVEAFPTGNLRICRDPDDDILLETAILGGAQYAVSRDDDMKRDLDLIDQMRTRGVEVVSVAQFLRILATVL